MTGFKTKEQELQKYLESKRMIESTDSTAEWLHDNYEMFSKDIGWQTQISTRTGYDNLPQKNKKVMRKMAKLVDGLRIQSKLSQLQADKEMVKDALKNLKTELHGTYSGDYNEEIDVVIDKLKARLEIE